MNDFKIANTYNYGQINFLDKILSNFSNCFIAGGCFKNIFNSERMKDLDIFFQSKEDFLTAVDKANEMGLRFLFRNKNIACFQFERPEVKIEMNCKIFGTPQEILKQFDFTITKFALYKELVEDEVEKDGVKTTESHLEDRVVFHRDYFEHLFFKRLVVDDAMPYPASTYERMIKYMRYGYEPCRETKVLIAKALMGLSPDTVVFSDAFYSEGID